MGMFTDGDGIPLAFSIFPGNQNEQQSLKPLEKTILQKFGHSKFIYCCDAGLGSEGNREFNHMGERSFIVTQSIKKLPAEDREWALSGDGFKRLSDDKPVGLSQIGEEKDGLFYKDCPYTTKKLHQRLIITYSPKYAAYQKEIRRRQVERAEKILICTLPSPHSCRMLSPLYCLFRILTEPSAKPHHPFLLFPISAGKKKCRILPALFQFPLFSKNDAVRVFFHIFHGFFQKAFGAYIFPQAGQFRLQSPDTPTLQLCLSQDVPPLSFFQNFFLMSLFFHILFPPPYIRGSVKSTSMFFITNLIFSRITPLFQKKKQ